MTLHGQRLDAETVSGIATTLRNAGISGAGGAGFPTYAKWERLDSVPFLLVNHQESEPNFYIDKWLAKTHAAGFAGFFESLLEDSFDLIVVCAKQSNREAWLGDLEAAVDGTVYGPADLPLDPESESGIVFAYTDDRYEYGMESVLLRLVAGVVLRGDLPMDHGWIVQNTETLWNVRHALDDGSPVTRKFVHVDGNVDRHRFLDVPVGTPVATLLEAAGRDAGSLGGDETVVDGGPGWCFPVDDPETFGVTKRTNCVLLLDSEMVAANTLGGGRVNVLRAREWTGKHETEPTVIEPELVRVPLTSNPDLAPVVTASQPIVEVGAEVAAGEMIATPGAEGFSTAQHASIDGTVTAVTERYIEISRDTGERGRETGQLLIYWTWCEECGEYIARPEPERLVGATGYVCEDCA
ncbi:NADH dehydrogenase subunit [Natronomonas sp. EA1]|uniref:NADH dehydrogenase subunit n=1 Tax=Natronomonas sp. EA1 TaxID=3421655 RepID=UPI003EBCBDE8